MDTTRCAVCFSQVFKIEQLALVQELKRRGREASPGHASDPAGLESPFGCIGATMDWETFHMVHILWLSSIETVATSPDKDWELEVSTNAESCVGRCVAPNSGLAWVGTTHNAWHGL